MLRLIGKTLEWWKARVEKVKENSKEFQSGYDFAAGALLASGGDSEDHLDDLSYMVDCEFDKGIRKALRDWGRNEGRLPE